MKETEAPRGGVGPSRSHCYRLEMGTALDSSFIYSIFSYLAVPGPVAALGIFDFCCSMWGYFYSQHERFSVAACGISFFDQGSKRGPLH